MDCKEIKKHLLEGGSLEKLADKYKFSGTPILNYMKLNAGKFDNIVFVKRSVK